LLAAFKNMGKNIVAFKCGPDYIDPMFHKKAIFTDSYNMEQKRVCGRATTPSPHSWHKRQVKGRYLKNQA